ncbi:hypothetical protein [Vogesella sp. LIG4]|uniref:hypothetical protein n=1 Tax=Vogesella sp. LIG4 TaxID=1192162 RepID=UPI00081FB439|nr:hypothetical protein [Vogesella sp. LIG4]SCK08498.1 hypothetical protein PSELUDRAFT_0512 [Vogesella sp. LIG4]
MVVILFLILLLPPVAWAGDVFHGYNAYYRYIGLPYFDPAYLMKANVLDEYQHGLRVRWRGVVHGRNREVVVKSGRFFVDGKALADSAISSFAGEAVNAGDLGRNTEVVSAGNLVCFQDTASSASGSAVRHKAVYLVIVGARVKVFKLPSLFASCLGVLRKNNELKFLKAKYRFQSGSDIAVGVVFESYLLAHDLTYSKDGIQYYVKFIDPEDVYKFVDMSSGNDGLSN